MTPKIHFVSFFGAGLDYDMLPYWLPHYESLGCDSYTVFLHLSKDPLLNKYVIAHFETYKFTVYPLPADVMEKQGGVNPLDVVKVSALESFAKNLPPEDFSLYADGDEIQIWNRLPREEVERGISIVIGDLVDRFDETLHPVDPFKTLHENYPMEHENLFQLVKDESHLTRKYCLYPSRFPINYIGNHAVKRGYDWKGPAPVTTGPIRIDHYHWRQSALERVQNRSYWSLEQIKATATFFGIELV